MDLEIYEKLESWLQNKDKRPPKVVVLIALATFIGASIIRALAWHYGIRIVLKMLLMLPNAFMQRVGLRGFFWKESPEDDWELNFRKAFWRKRKDPDANGS